MQTERAFDAIVVGGRCAGSSSAMLLSRNGYRVLLLDRGAFPSDLKASTHLIGQGGVARLARWGLLEKVAGTNCAPMSGMSLDLGEFALHGHPTPAGEVDRAYAPRRYLLDAILSEAAQDSGVEFRQGCRVDGLLTHDGRVHGVRYTDERGLAAEAHATIVIGADGTQSTVARHANATAYNEHPRLQGTVWAYFSDLPVDDIEFYARPGRMVFAWPTNDGLTLAGICIRFDEFSRFVTDLDNTVPAELEVLAPVFSERVRAARRETPWMAGGTRGVCRKPFGPGWALVGDAGLTMDPITAAGISNAFRDAELLTDAINQGFGTAESIDGALARFEEQRNAASVARFEFTRELARLDPPSQSTIELLTSLRGNQEDTDAYFGVFAQTVPVSAFFAPENIARILSGEASPDGRS
jgi:flavin-dependent dehydrogenase